METDLRTVHIPVSLSDGNRAATVSLARDIRMIRACRSVEELDAYEAEAKLTRRLDPWEVTALLEMRRKLAGRR